MSTHTPPRTVVYPDSDGLPMSDNTLQFQWITTLVGGLDALYRDDPDVFVAGDLLWYPIEGDNKTRTAPDAMVVFGRPKGYRGSYMQWREEGVAPQVVFEVRSPGNRFGEMARKLAFYDRFEVEEYYLLNPDPIELEGWLRVDGALREIAETNGWVSPRCGIRFVVDEGDLRILRPDGRPFEPYSELDRRAEEESRRAEEANRRAEEASRRAEEASRRAEEASRRAEEASRRAEEEHQSAIRLAEKLRALGIDPDA